MIISLNEKIKSRRLEIGLKQKDIQNLSFRYFDENEVVNENYFQKVESAKFQNLELWTLYKLSSILESDILFSNTENKVDFKIDGQIHSINYSSLLPIDQNYSKNHRGAEYKNQFLTLVGTYIRDSRNEFNLTQIEFSRNCSISRATLQRLELGLVSAKLNTIIKVLFTIYKLKDERNQ
ncbi:helix-turn-helix domain-containing protein [Arcobacter sp.]|uniref:helix-turn-helix domain-containing protein n=1 Tax=Arcobacter sp. TaxID=1872629 RepID=UPI003D128288